MIITVCAKCGSQDLERLAWVTLRSKQMTEFVDAGDFPKEPINYCNNCGERCEVIDLRYMEKYGTAYKIIGNAANKDAVLICYPMLTDSTISLMGECEVDIHNSFTAQECREFFKEMINLFPNNRVDIIQIFKPHIDLVKEFVTEKAEVVIDILFREAHEEFKTQSGDIEPMQELRLDRIKTDLIDLVTEQVKQNM